ncbi:uncharacterized protein LOC108680906 isoform X2 [Hyalella azteca]|uniref:Uncharacterized protein LOC108680906 isoform X2 n=1 Tax=Hyalella azteca TaxID=294128 RepID=A0A8B7PGQ5_HYAAZ|nr:uncharacterized protein LOC108680906 isoform X2 [Hyalella azteca]
MKLSIQVYVANIFLYFFEFSAVVQDSATQPCDHPNILFIIVDDLRPSVGCYGDSLAITPSIDALAGAGVTFDLAFAQQALCGPSRTSLLTSRRPDTTGVVDAHHYWRDTHNFTTLPQHFKQHGYYTASAGKVFHPGRCSNYSDDAPYSWSAVPYHPSSEQYKNFPACGPHKNMTNIVCPVLVRDQPESTLPDLQTTHYAISFLQHWKNVQNGGQLNENLMPTDYHFWRKNYRVRRQKGFMKDNKESVSLTNTRYLKRTTEYDLFNIDGKKEMTRRAFQRQKTKCTRQTDQTRRKFLSSKNESHGGCQPFFLAVGYHKPHIPLKFPRRFLELFPLPEVPLPPDDRLPPGLPSVAYNPWNDLRWRDDVAALNLSFPYQPMPDDYSRLIRQAYYAATAYTDSLIENLLSATSLLHPHTLVVLMGDHGWSLGEHQEWSKFSNYEVATRVPLVMAPISRYAQAKHSLMTDQRNPKYNRYKTYRKLGEKLLSRLHKWPGSVRVNYEQYWKDKNGDEVKMHSRSFNFYGWLKKHMLHDFRKLSGVEQSRNFHGDVKSTLDVKSVVDKGRKIWLNLKENYTYTGLVELVDVFPTLADLAGISKVPPCSFDWMTSRFNEDYIRSRNNKYCNGSCVCDRINFKNVSIDVKHANCSECCHVRDKTSNLRLSHARSIIQQKLLVKFYKAMNRHHKLPFPFYNSSLPDNNYFAQTDKTNFYLIASKFMRSSSLNWKFPHSTAKTCTEGRSVAPYIVDEADAQESEDVRLNRQRNSKIKLAASDVSAIRPVSRVVDLGRCLKDMLQGKLAISQYPRPSLSPSQHPDSDQPKLKEIKVMGYSMRSHCFRYTLWVAYNCTTQVPDFDDIAGEELYDHRFDPREDHNILRLI